MENDQRKKIERINEINRIISDLKYFHETIDVWAEIPSQTKAIIKVKIDKSFSFFGSRYFGVGTHKSEISVPPTLIKELVMLNYKQIEQYENELNQLLGLKHEPLPSS